MQSCTCPRSISMRSQLACVGIALPVRCSACNKWVGVLTSSPLSHKGYAGALITAVVYMTAPSLINDQQLLTAADFVVIVMSVQKLCKAISKLNESAIKLHSSVGSLDRICSYLNMKCFIYDDPSIEQTPRKTTPRVQEDLTIPNAVSPALSDVQAHEGDCTFFKEFSHQRVQQRHMLHGGCTCHICHSNNMVCMCMASQGRLDVLVVFT